MPEQYPLFFKILYGLSPTGGRMVPDCRKFRLRWADTTRLRHLSSPKQLLRASHHDER